MLCALGLGQSLVASIRDYNRLLLPLEFKGHKSAYQCNVLRDIVKKYSIKGVEDYNTLKVLSLNYFKNPSKSPANIASITYRGYLRAYNCQRLRRSYILLPQRLDILNKYIQSRVYAIYYNSYFKGAQQLFCFTALVNNIISPKYILLLLNIRQPSRSYTIVILIITLRNYYYISLVLYPNTAFIFIIPPFIDQYCSNIILYINNNGNSAIQGVSSYTVRLYPVRRLIVTIIGLKLQLDPTIIGLGSFLPLSYTPL